MNKVLKSKIVLEYGTQSDFAQAIGENPTVVSNVIQLRRAISERKMLEWANALGCKPNDIFPRDMIDAGLVKT